MNTNEKLRQLMEALQHILPPYGDMMHNGIAGEGQSNIAAERTQEMHRLAVYFARAYQSKARADQVQDRTDDLVGAIRTIATLGVIKPDYADKLIDDTQE